MNYALIQIEKIIDYNIHSPYFRVILTNMTLEEAKNERNKMKDPGIYIIIQVF